MKGEKLALSRARSHARVHYAAALAERLPLRDRSVDLAEESGGDLRESRRLLEMGGVARLLDEAGLLERGQRVGGIPPCQRRMTAEAIENSPRGRFRATRF